MPSKRMRSLPLKRSKRDRKVRTKSDANLATPAITVLLPGDVVLPSKDSVVRLTNDPYFNVLVRDEIVNFLNQETETAHCEIAERVLQKIAAKRGRVLVPANNKTDKGWRLLSFSDTIKEIIQVFEKEKNFLTRVVNSDVPVNSKAKPIEAFGTDVILPTSRCVPEAAHATNNPNFNQLLEQLAPAYTCAANPLADNHIVHRISNEMQRRCGRFLRERSGEKNTWTLLNFNEIFYELHRILASVRMANSGRVPLLEKGPQRKKLKVDQNQPKNPSLDLPPIHRMPYPRPVIPLPFIPLARPPPPVLAPRRLENIEETNSALGSSTEESTQNATNRTRKVHFSVQPVKYPRRMEEEEYIVTTNRFDVLIDVYCDKEQYTIFQYGDWNLQLVLLNHYDMYFTGFANNDLLDKIAETIHKSGGRFLKRTHLSSTCTARVPCWSQASQGERNQHIERVFLNLKRGASTKKSDWKARYAALIFQSMTRMNNPQPSEETVPSSSDENEPYSLACKPEHFANATQHVSVRNLLMKENPSLRQHYDLFYGDESFAPKGHAQDFVWLSENSNLTNQE